MTDEELIMAVAQEVMGWTANQNLSVDADLHITGDGRLWWYGSYTQQKQYSYTLATSEEWNPLLNANHWMMVVGRMRELGWEFTMYYGTDKDGLIDEWACFEKDNFSSKIYGSPIGHAVCEAALKAVRHG